MRERLQLYQEQALHYIHNASLALQEGDVEKASEFLWGSMAESLKAVAACKGQLLRTHQELRIFARGLAREIKEPGIEEAYSRAEKLHANFYESFLEPEDLALDMERIREAVRRLFELVETSESEVF